MLWGERSSGGRPSEISQKAMSALPPKADMCSAQPHVCFGPKADMALFDHLIGNGDQSGRNFDADRPRGCQIDDEFVPARTCNREISGLFALEDAADVEAGL